MEKFWNLKPSVNLPPPPPPLVDTEELVAAILCFQYEEHCTRKKKATGCNPSFGAAAHIAEPCPRNGADCRSLEIDMSVCLLP